MLIKSLAECSAASEEDIDPEMAPTLRNHGTWFPVSNQRFGSPGGLIMLHLLQQAYLPSSIGAASFLQPFAKSPKY
jgi:hypothetical protein